MDEKTRTQLISPVVPENILHNSKILTRTHAQTSLILGLGAGILALSAWQGFVFYLVGYLAITGALLAKAGDLTGTRYWKGGFDVWSQEVFSGLLSFVLSWTLSYALVHVYD